MKFLLIKNIQKFIIIKSLLVNKFKKKYFYFYRFMFIEIMYNNNF